MIDIARKSEQKCWSCGAETMLDALFCEQCQVIQPPGQSSHFERLGLSEQFDLDREALEKRYLELQRQLHPDRFAGKPQEEKNFSMQQTMTLNEAYQTLKSPLSRAEYLLLQTGIRVNTEEDSVKPEPELLMEMMELRESIQDAETTEAVDSLIKDLAHRLEISESRLGQSFVAGNMEDAAQETIRLKYLTKSLEEAKARRKRLAA